MHRGADMAMAMTGVRSEKAIALPGGLIEVPGGLEPPAAGV